MAVSGGRKLSVMTNSSSSGTEAKMVGYADRLVKLDSIHNCRATGKGELNNCRNPWGIKAFSWWCAVVERKSDE